MTTGDRVVTFQGHHSYLVSIAKLCKENGLFTDVTILCDDGKLVAHRIVLAAVSPFLCHVLDAATGDTPATTIIMPDVRKEIVQQLLEFLYTGIMKLSPSATWELQQLVLLLQIDPQNVGVDTIRGGLDPDKYDRLSSSVCQTLGIKIAHKADISAQHKVSPKHSPTPATKPASNVVKVPPKVSSPKSARSPPLTNGLKERLAESPKNSTPPPTNQVKHSATPTLKIVNSTLKTTLKTKGQDSKPGRKTQEKSLNPLKLSISSGSIIRANDSNDSFKQSHHLKDSQNNISSITSSVTPDSSNVIPNLKIVTRKRPLSEKIDYSEMIEEEGVGGGLAKRGRGGKSRGKGGGMRGGKGSGRSRGDEVVCAICNQFDPTFPSHYKQHNNKVEWIGCDCNRWFHKFCTRLKEVDDNFSCRLVHKTCLPMPGKTGS